MPKFSIKDLLIATTLIALGLGGAGVSQSLADPHLALTYLMIRLPLHLAGWMIVGCGVLFPFRMSYLGAFLGLVVGTAIVAAQR